MAVLLSLLFIGFMQAAPFSGPVSGMAGILAR
jgi:hypothetical protein